MILKISDFYKDSFLDEFKKTIGQIYNQQRNSSNFEERPRSRRLCTSIADDDISSQFINSVFEIKEKQKEQELMNHSGNDESFRDHIPSQEALENLIQALEEKIQKQLESHNDLFLRKVEEILENNFDVFKNKFEEFKLKHQDDLTMIKKQMSQGQSRL